MKYALAHVVDFALFVCLGVVGIPVVMVAWHAYQDGEETKMVATLSFLAFTCFATMARLLFVKR